MSCTRVVETVADFGVVVDPVDFVFWHGILCEIAIACVTEKNVTSFILCPYAIHTGAHTVLRLIQ